MVAVERVRQGLFGAALALAAAAAWVAGGALFAPTARAGDPALVALPFPAPPAAEGPRREDRASEAFRGITSRQLVPPAPVTGVSGGPPPFRLLGTTYNPTAPQDSSAIVMNSRGVPKGYKVGQMVDVDQAKLLGVAGPKARFFWQGREVELGPDGPPVPALKLERATVPVSGVQVVKVTPQEWAALYADLPALQNQVRVDVRMVNGRKEGLEITAMAPECPLRRFGLQPQDVVHKLNGKALSPLEVVQILPTLSKPQPLVLEVERDGKRFTLTVEPGEAAAP